MVRVIKDLAAEKYRVKFMSENVASMDDQDRDVFTGLWRAKPVRACSRGLSQVRRPRYYWFNWIVPESPGVAVQQQAEVFVRLLHGHAAEIV